LDGADGRELYRHAKTAGYLYQAALRAELSFELGLRWQALERGSADLEGVPRWVIEHFSLRRAEILEPWARAGRRRPARHKLRRWRLAGARTTACPSTGSVPSGARGPPSMASTAPR